MASPSESRDPTLCRLFVGRAKAAFASRPEIKHSWFLDADEDHCVLEITGDGTPGFDISAEVWPSEIILRAEGWHARHDAKEPLDDFVTEIVSLLQEMMSPAMRIREQLSRGTPYRWHLEKLKDGDWVTESTTSLVFRPWFGAKAEMVYVNHILPVRPPSE